MEGRCPIVGRDGELDFLMSHMAKSLEGQGGLVLVFGEAGSGKTTLCAELQRFACTSGCLVLIGRCIPNSQSPYLPFIEAFYNQTPSPFSLRDERSATIMGQLLPSTLECIEGLSKEAGLVLVIEDLHWADSASVALMHFLARNVRTMKVMILGTYRPEELNIARQEEVRPLKDTLRIMRREAICHELGLRPLDPEDTRKLVSLVLDGPAEDLLLDLVADESKGNPLFAVEMVRYLVEGEQLVNRDGMWRIEQKDKVLIPSTVREVILARTENVPKDTKRIMEYASVIGEYFEPRLIEASFEIDRIQLLNQLESLEKEYQLIIEEEQNYRFSHEKIRQVVYDQISNHRRKEMHRSIGRRLEGCLPNNDLLGLLSYHFNEADEGEKCIKYSLSAGMFCSKKKAYREAKIYFQRVLKRTEAKDEFIAERLEALEGLGDLGSTIQTPSEWYSYYERFLELNRDRKARARVLAKAAECWDQMGLADRTKANQLLDEAESISEGDSSILANIELRRADLFINDNRVREHLDHVNRARAYYDDIGDRLGILKCCLAEMWSHAWQSKFIEAKALAQELMVMAKDLNDPEQILYSKLGMIYVCDKMGEIELAKSNASEAIKLASDLGLPFYWRRALIERGFVQEVEGTFESAIRDFTVALRSAEELEYPIHIWMCEMGLGIGELCLGHLDAAEYHYVKASGILSTMDSGVRVSGSAYDSILRAQLLAARGSTRASDALFEETISLFEKSAVLDDLMELHTKYGMSLAKRGTTGKALTQFHSAMGIAKAIGCEKRVHCFAKQVGLTLD